MIRIAYVITDLSYGGAQTMLLELLNELDNNEFEVAVFVREQRLGTAIEQGIEELGVPCTYLRIGDGLFKGSKVIHKYKSQLQFNKAMKAFKPDIVHSHLENSYSLIYCYLFNVNNIFTIHSFPDRIFTKQFIILQHLLKMKGLTKLVGCATCVSERASELLGNSFRSSISTIFNPINVQRYHKLTNNEKSDVVFVNVARMHPIKNQMLLLKAFSIVINKCANARLLIVGDGELNKVLNDEAERLKINNYVHFLGNRIDVPDILAKSDVFVLSSNSECCPMTILEAMATGLPVVSTDVGGVREIVADAGILTPAKDENSLANAMISLCEEEALRKKLGDLGKARAQYFDSKYIAYCYSKTYKTIVKEEV